MNRILSPPFLFPVFCVQFQALKSKIENQEDMINDLIDIVDAQTRRIQAIEAALEELRAGAACTPWVVVEPSS